MKKKIDVRTYDTIDLDCKTLDNIFEEIKHLIKEYGGSAKIYNCREDYSSSDKEYSYIYISRDETDEEYSKRLAEEEKYKELREERDRQEFKRLREKFGK